MFGWFSKRPRRRIPPQPPAARDWGVGNVAHCLLGGTWVDCDTREPKPGPATGQVLRVSGIMADDASVWLQFAQFPEHHFPAGYFRKVVSCSADFREQIRRRSPALARKPELVP